MGVSSTSEFPSSSLPPCASSSDAAALRTYVTTYANHSTQSFYQNRVYVSTFAGQTCTFGQGSVASGWSSQFTSALTGTNAVYLVPSFFVDPSTFNTYNGIMDGALNWDSAWPVSLTASSGLPSSLSLTVSDSVAAAMSGLATDANYINGLNTMFNSASKSYLPTVSPWFFTHYGANSYNKNWMYYGDQHMYARRWQALVESRDKFDVIDVISWNDYGESSYIGPIEGEGAQPNSQAWVDGFDHTAWLYMTSYFSKAIKAGVWPTVTQDKICMWSRPHPRDASTSDSVGRPTNYQLTADAVWAVVFAKSAGTVTLKTSDSNSQTFAVVAGMNKLSIAISAGGTMYAKLVRDGQTVVELSPSFTFNGSPSSYNYNAFAASSS
ncbi:glycoside hydrolase [Amylostereum chailletii]|nr:glycoside hydrolase [Amylostereum chailletii]